MRRLLLACLVCIGLFASANSDALISAKIKTKLSRSKLKGDGLQFKVNQGTVEWEGVVTIPQHKGAATRMARTSGASNVVNRIVVKAGTKAKAKDGTRAKTVHPPPREVTVQVPKR